MLAAFGVGLAIGGLFGVITAAVLVADKKFHSAPQWIPVSERLPDHDGYYLITTTTGIVGIGLYITKEDGIYGTIGTAAAWMPLPDPAREV